MPRADAAGQPGVSSQNHWKAGGWQLTQRKAWKSVQLAAVALPSQQEVEWNGRRRAARSLGVMGRWMLLGPGGQPLEGLRGEFTVFATPSADLRRQPGRRRAPRAVSRGV